MSASSDVLVSLSPSHIRMALRQSQSLLPRLNALRSLASSASGESPMLSSRNRPDADAHGTHWHQSHHLCCPDVNARMRSPDTDHHISSSQCLALLPPSRFVTNRILLSRQSK